MSKVKGLLFLGGKEVIIREFETPKPSDGEDADVSWDACGNPTAMVQTLEAAKI